MALLICWMSREVCDLRLEGEHPRVRERTGLPRVLGDTAALEAPECPFPWGGVPSVTPGGGEAGPSHLPHPPLQTSYIPANKHQGWQLALYPSPGFWNPGISALWDGNKATMGPRQARAPAAMGLSLEEGCSLEKLGWVSEVPFLGQRQGSLLGVADHVTERGHSPSPSSRPWPRPWGLWPTTPVPVCTSGVSNVAGVTSGEREEMGISVNLRQQFRDGSRLCHPRESSYRAAGALGTSCPEQSQT